MSSPRRPLIWALFGIAAVALAGYFAHLGLIRPDETYNLQVAKSLATHFTYARLYRPAIVYDPRITTNGLIQYVGALLFALGLNVIGVITVTSVLGMAFLTIGLWLLRPWLTTLAIALFLIWPNFFKSSTNFLGDIWAAGLAIIGIALLERVLAGRDFRAAVRSPLFVASTICLAAAVSIKLIAAVLIAPLALAVAARARRNPLAVTFLALAIAAALFLAQFAFSVLHSTSGDISQILPTLERFLNEHHRQAMARIALNGILRGPHYFPSALLFAGTIIGSIALALEWTAALPFVLVVWGLFACGLGDRELVPAFILLLAFGLRSLERFAESVLQRAPSSTTFRAAIVGALLAMLPAVSGTAVGGPVFALVPAAQRQSIAYTSRAIYHYHANFIHAIAEQRYVATTGWFQFPEVSILHGFTFYDRLDPANANLPRGDVALLFDATQRQDADPDGVPFAKTTIRANCGALIARDGPLVLCRARADEPLSYVAPGPKAATAQ